MSTTIRPAVRPRRVAAAGVNRRPGPGVYTLLVVAVVAAVMPFWYTFLISSHDRSATNYGAFPLLPGTLLPEHVVQVLQTIPFWASLLNSLIVSGVTAVSVVFFSTLAGYAFAKLRFRGRTPLFVFVLATMAVPTQLGVIPLFMLMAQYHLVGSVWSVIIPGLVNAFGVFWMTQYLRDVIPDELIEAARLDGANSIRTFWHVAAPAARPAASMLALFTFVAAWTNYFWPSIALSGANQTLTVALQQLAASRSVDYSLVLTGVLLASLPLIVLLIAAGRQLIAGIMSGAVKG